MSIKEEILIKTCVEGYGIILLATMFSRKYGIFSRESIKKGNFKLVDCLDRSVVAYQNRVIHIINNHKEITCLTTAMFNVLKLALMTARRSQEKCRIPPVNL